MNARTGLALLMVLAVGGCSKTWMRDESHRIEDAMRCPRFNPESREAHGIGLFEAAPLAAPWQPGEKYELGAGRKQRLGREDAAPPRLKQQGAKTKRKRGPR